MTRTVNVAAALISAGAITLLQAGAAAAAPEATGAGGVTDPAITTIVNTVGDDLFSTTDITSLLNPGGATPTQHFGPYPSSSPDSGTCGNDWATDYFDRHFTVRSNPATGSVTVVEQFKNGSFTTNAGPSPGACETNPGGTLMAGHTGSTHGYFVISNVGSQTSSSPYCDAGAMTNSGCTTMTFINTHFAPCYPVTCQVTTYFFDYAAGDQGLAYHDWKNASPDRGGDHGDISDT